MRRASMWLNLYGCQAVGRKLKKGLKTQKKASINTSIPRTNTWNFGRNCSAFGEVEKLSFFESAILNFFPKKNFFLLHPFENQSQILYSNGWDSIFNGLQPKISVGIIYLHECSSKLKQSWFEDLYVF